MKSRGWSLNPEHLRLSRIKEEPDGHGLVRAALRAPPRLVVKVIKPVQQAEQHEMIQFLGKQKKYLRVAPQRAS